MTSDEELILEAHNNVMKRLLSGVPREQGQLEREIVRLTKQKTRQDFAEKALTRYYKIYNTKQSNMDCLKQIEAWLNKEAERGGRNVSRCCTPEPCNSKREAEL